MIRNKGNKFKSSRLKKHKSKKSGHIMPGFKYFLQEGMKLKKESVAFKNK